MKHYLIILPFFSFFLYSFVFADTETIHWEWRDLICQTDKGIGEDKVSEKPAECTIALRETEKDKNRRLAPKGAGCFDENHNGTIRTYCDVLCPNADTVYLIKRDPQVHRSCFVFYTHKLERRGQNWFLWRQHKYCIPIGVAQIVASGKFIAFYYNSSRIQPILMNLVSN